MQYPTIPQSILLKNCLNSNCYNIQKYIFISAKTHPTMFEVCAARLELSLHYHILKTST